MYTTQPHGLEQIYDYDSSAGEEVVEVEIGPVEHVEFPSLGLHAIENEHHLFVKQIKKDFPELERWGKGNRFVIFNGQNEEIFYVVERKGSCGGLWCGLCCGTRKCLELHVLNATFEEVIAVGRVDDGCVKECHAEGRFVIRIEAPLGYLSSYITGVESCTSLRAIIQDNQGRKLFHIDNNCTELGDWRLPIVNTFGSTVGQLSRHTGHGTDSGKIFGLTIPSNLNARDKATLLMATFLFM